MTDKPSAAPANPAPAASPADAAQPAYRVTLPEFEGPLDLLLHLCQTHELDILNISIAFIAQKYIEYLELMENLSVEVAADYLVMAAHLAYLKSRELVPSPEPVEASEDGEDPIDPREELIRRLLQYQKYKHAAQTLADRPIEGRNVFVRGAVLQPEGEAGLAEHSVWKLIEHWARVLEKAKPQVTHDVVVDRISISDRINQLVDMLEAGKGMVQFDDLIGHDLPEAELRHKVVVSLLAVLELARLRVVRIMHQEATGVFYLTRVEGAVLSDARHLNVTSAKSAEREASPAAAAAIAGETETEETPVGSAEPEPAAEGAVASEPDTAEEAFAPAATATAQGMALPAEPPEGDSADISTQEDVISALPPAPTDAGENQSDGQTKAKQEDSSD